MKSWRALKAKSFLHLTASLGIQITMGYFPAVRRVIALRTRGLSLFAQGEMKAKSGPYCQVIEVGQN
jgi:hypothetical protein